MQIITSVTKLQNIISEYTQSGKSIGFVPTMGALHDGHISLIKLAKQQTDICICSIFVNPTQFNNKKDLKKYPRNLEQDAILLEKAKCDFIFAPSVAQIYPKSLDTTISFDMGGLDKLLEGEFRPGHFQGMTQVVNRLLQIVTPNYLYMGQKDFQQFTIVGRMIKKLKINTKLVVCPIKREKNGLAMSSRNERLSPTQRSEAALINKTMKWAISNITKYSISELQKKALIKLSIDGFKPEYFSFVNGLTLKQISSAENTSYIVLVVAVWVGEVRLIDNMIVKQD
jgi:pantoate--beta-alanine ligase